MGGMEFGLIITLVAVVLLGAWIVGAYNGLVKARNRVDNAWGQIDVQLQRRHDLVPNLVETVRGYAGHERETLEAVVEARNRAVAASEPSELAGAEQQLMGALGRLFALSEAYPELRSSETFAALQAQLEETEDKVAIARQIYNDSVLSYNDRVQTLPSNLIASATGMDVRQYFDADADAGEPPRVEF